MATNTRVVLYYAVWATLCAAAAGIAVAAVHTAFFAWAPSRAERLHVLFGDLVTALALAAGQGAVVLVTGSVLQRMGRSLEATTLLGLVIGAFDVLMYGLQMVFPVLELGWIPDVLILVCVAAGTTLWGARAAAATAVPR